MRRFLGSLRTIRVYINLGEDMHPIHCKALIPISDPRTKNQKLEMNDIRSTAASQIPMVATFDSSRE
jgi:hypothetical protein